MRLDRAGKPQGPMIEGMSARGFRVDDGIYPALAITPLRADQWTPPPIEVLAIADLAPLFAIEPQPEFILLGTGARMIRPPANLIMALEARDIGIEYMDSRAAARAWGVLRAELRWIAAGLYPLG